MSERLDIIGDVHGHHEALLRLGRALGYAVDEGWRAPPGRRLLFLGDLVDRGPDSLAVAQLVRSLCETGRALCLMGNHEFNLVEWRRGRAEPKASNRPTIADVEARWDAWSPVLDFFETLPLAVELPDLRATHAVWHEACIDLLTEALATPAVPRALDAFWAPRVRLHSPYVRGNLRDAVPEEPFEDQWAGPLEVFLKGHEGSAREPFHDGDGHLRDKERVEWWRPDCDAVPRDRRVVFGHYWNMPPVAHRHEAFVPPHPSGHPMLRAWFDETLPAVPSSGRERVPASVRAVCIDYNGVARATGGRPCVGAYRYPEAEVVWST